MNIKKVWILNFAIFILITILAVFQFLTDVYVLDDSSNYEVYWESTTGIESIWVLVAAIIFYFFTVPYVIKIIWNEYFVRLPNISKIQYAHAVLIVLIIPLIGGW